MYNKFLVTIFFLLFFYVGNINAQILNIQTIPKKGNSELSILKDATEIYMIQERFMILDIGADFDIFIKNYTKTRTGNNVFTVNAKIQFSNQRKSINTEKEIIFSYDVTKNAVLSGTDPIVENVKEALKEHNETTVLEGIVGGKVISNIIKITYDKIKF